MRPECQQCQEWMEEAFGDELKLEHRSALDSHLAGCADCRVSWDEFRLLRRGLDALAADEDGPSPFVEAKILRAAAARHAERPSGFWRWLLRPATVGFATLALIAGLGYLGREELLRHRRPDDLTAPVPPVSVPAPRAVPAQAGDSSTSTAPAPAKPMVPPPAPKEQKTDSKPKQEAEKPGKAVEGGVSQQPAPAAASTVSPPAPVEEKARAVSAPAPDSAPAGGGAMKDGPDLKNEGRAREANIPEAEYAAPEASRQEDRKKSAEPKEAEQVPAKSLQRAAPQPAAPSSPDGLAGPAADKADTGLGSGQALKELGQDGRFDSLLRSAKAKIQRQDYAGALDDLLAAQKLRDNKEIQDLILLCRSHLRGDG